MGGELVQKILVIDLGGIGDVLLSTPALEALQELYPHATLTSLVSTSGKEILEGLSCLHRIVIFPISETELASPWLGVRWNKLFQLFCVCLTLRRELFDRVINLRPLNSRGSALKMALLMGLIGGKERVGRDTKGRGFFLTRRISEDHLEGHHELDYILNVVDHLGGKTIRHPIEIAIAPKEEKSLERILVQEGISPQDRLIAFHPGSPFSSKRWPLERFIGVADALHKRVGAKIVVIGGRDEISFGKSFQEALPGKTISLCGKITLKELSLLLKRCLLLVTNDTGPMHLAAYMGTPLVALFHSGTFRYFPQGDPKKCIVFGSNDEETFWERHRVHDRGVLDTISQEVVLNAALSLLERYFQ